MTGSMLDAITPVILTYNEEVNIGRTLSGLQWAHDIVVVDSGSTDSTLDILRGDRRVRLYTRPFESHHSQWAFATSETDIKTPWILRLDADYLVTPELVAEMAGLAPEGSENAFRIGFAYAIYSKRLVGSLYPPNTVLLRRGKFSIRDAGHTESWHVEGPVGELKSVIVHDDWKPMSAFIAAQTKYMARELNAPPRADRRFRDWLRRYPPLMPIAVFVYCLFGKGLIFSGREGLLYTWQRTLAEAIYSLLYLEKVCRKSTSNSSSQ
jgi:glycosyltransferase involved in cell wall biosynthesis